MQGCGAAYYLMHSMTAVGFAYRNHDRTLARTFVGAAERAGVKRIIYLVGLGATEAALSEHLTSRREAATALASTSVTVPVTVLRAARIIGEGSATFEILRYLVERLSAMVTQRCVSTQSQPIAIRNVLHCSVACLQIQETSLGMQLQVGPSAVEANGHRVHAPPLRSTIGR